MQALLKIFMTLILVTVESDALYRLAALCLNCLCFSPKVSATEQAFLLLPMFELTGFSEPRIQTVEKNCLCTVVHSFILSILLGGYWGGHHKGRHLSKLHLSHTVLPTLPWGRLGSIPCGSVPSVTDFLPQNLQHFLHFPKNLGPP